MSKYDDLCVSDAVHAREVELPGGVKRTLYFKEVSALVYRKFQITESSEDDDVRATSLAKLIAASLCEPDGSPALTFEKACTLKAGPSNAILNAVLEVNGKKSGNESPPAETNGSGTSSPSDSAAKP